MRGLAAAVLSQAFRQRQPHLKACVSWFRRDLNISPVLLHNSLNCVEAEPGTFPNSLGCKKGFKDVRPYLGQNARAIVGNLNHNAIVLAISANDKLTFPIHRVSGVVDKIGPNLI